MIRRSICAGLFVGLLLALAWIPAAGAPAQAGPFNMNFRSQAARDGHIEESSENSNMGGFKWNDTGAFAMGDDSSDRQVRGILSFNTAGLPDNATITQAQLKVETSGIVFGTDPFITLGALVVDIRKGFFGSSASLELIDFQAARHAGAGTIPNTPVSGWYTSNLNSTSFAYINRIGTTQFRLRFQLQDDDDLTFDHRSFWSGDVITLADRPVLRIWYTTP